MTEDGSGSSASVTDVTEQDVYRYLTDRLQPIYADLVATLGEKPTQVVFQFEAAFVHLAVAQQYPAKIRAFRQFHLWYLLREQAVGIAIGVLASLIAAAILALL